MENKEQNGERVPFIQLDPADLQAFHDFYATLSARAIGFEEIEELWEDGYSIEEAIEYTDWRMEQAAKELFSEF